MVQEITGMVREITGMVRENDDFYFLLYWEGTTKTMIFTSTCPLFTSTFPLFTSVCTGTAQKTIIFYPIV